jgi:hypothetical protein
MSGKAKHREGGAVHPDRLLVGTMRTSRCLRLSTMGRIFCRESDGEEVKPMCYSYREYRMEQEARRQRDEEERKRREERVKKADKERAKEERELVKA